MIQKFLMRLSLEKKILSTTIAMAIAERKEVTGVVMKCLNWPKESRMNAS